MFGKPLTFFQAQYLGCLFLNWTGVGNVSTFVLLLAGALMIYEVVKETPIPRYELADE